MTDRPLPREAALIVNALSRKGQDLFQQAKEKLGAKGIKLLTAEAVENPDDLAARVKQAVKNGAPMVIVGGGDGSLSGTVDELVGHDCVFAVLPLGTANSFARTLGMPLELDGAVEVIATGRRRRIDLGMIGNDYFVNAAAMGLSPIIGETVPHNLKRYLGRPGYLLWALRCAVNFRAFQLTIDDGTRRSTMWSTEVRILNGPFHGGVELSDQADVASGAIVVQAVVGKSPARLAWDWYAKFFKLRDRNFHTEEFPGTSFDLSTQPPQKVSIDGEVLTKTPINVSVAKKAIDVAAARLERP